MDTEIIDTIPLQDDTAAAAFAALGSEARLAVIRALVRAGPEGAPVGALQEKLGVPASTLSHHIRFLTAAGLVAQTRDGRRLICTAAFSRIEALAAYLIRECCADAAPGAAHDHAGHTHSVKETRA